MANKLAQDIIYSACNDSHIEDSASKRFDPLLKLYIDRPLMINNNIDVKNCIANGAMCKFKGIVLKDNKTLECLHKIEVDGFYVNCVEASDVQSLVVEMLDGNKKGCVPKIVHLPTQNVRATVKFPIPIDGPVTKHTKRLQRKIKFEQFPINVANARTVHKLQGRSIEKLVISSWDYTGNWIYVFLSRCSTLDGIFIRNKLKKTRAMSEKCIEFHDLFRKNKSPKQEIENIYEYRNVRPRLSNTT